MKHPHIKISQSKTQKYPLFRVKRLTSAISFSPDWAEPAVLVLGQRKKEGRPGAWGLGPGAEQPLHPGRQGGGHSEGVVESTQSLLGIAEGILPGGHAWHAASTPETPSHTCVLMYTR